MQLEICKFKVGDKIVVTKNLSGNCIKMGHTGVVERIDPSRYSDHDTPNCICRVKFDNIPIEGTTTPSFWTSPDRMRLNKVENWRQELE